MAAWRLRLEEAEREREQALASLAGAQRLHALGRLAAGAAHDFRNALAVVSGAADALRQTTRPEQVREIAEDLEAAADQCQPHRQPSWWPSAATATRGRPAGPTRW